jgi:hypothetical protein
VTGRKREAALEKNEKRIVIVKNAFTLAGPGSMPARL